jgi:hypothetical protein
MNKLALLAVIPLSLGACLDTGADESSAEQAATGEAGHGAPEHLQQTKDAAPAGTTSGSPLLAWGGGGVLHANKTQAIFWGANWSSTSFAGDKIAGIDTFFGGFGGSLYAGASTEYTDSTGSVTSSSAYLGHVMDTTSSPPTKALTTSSAVAEACKIANNSPDPNALYLIYTQNGPSHASYCAWHSWGTCSTGAPIQVAYMPNIDGIAGCDPGAPYAGHSQGLAALANVTAHELSEAITDPRGTGWTDSGGAENGDKCAWSFSPTNGGVVTLSNSSTWKLQGEWSNAAYNASTGYANRSGQLACLPFH